jgi:hypothetical protein
LAVAVEPVVITIAEAQPVVLLNSVLTVLLVAEGVAPVM